MYRFFVKSIGASALIATTVMLASCGGSSGTSSSGGGSFSAGNTVVQGNVSPSGAVSMGFSSSETIASASVRATRTRLFNIILPRAEAQALAGVEVCLNGVCVDTDTEGNFMIVLPEGTPGGLYEIMFTTLDGTEYTAEINVKNSTIMSFQAVLQEEEGQVKITNVVIEVTAPEEELGEETEDEPVEKFVICHKPGTPAQQNLVLPASAIPAHLGHGDTEGGCDIEF